ncbi:MAG TPA: C_GCAxxG_C_C family protein, partial [Euryarchaeota archaeon]|nr:C_GCAxxG_C_C family protein [Euryarchaeota archaeon]
MLTLLKGLDSTVIAMNEPKADLNALNEKGRTELAQRAYELAYHYEGEYGSCPQAVLSSIQEVLGIVDDEVIKSGHSLAGGAALSGQGTCGALVGGIMAISCRFGRPRSM